MVWNGFVVETITISVMVSIVLFFFSRAVRSDFECAFGSKMQTSESAL